MRPRLAVGAVMIVMLLAGCEQDALGPAAISQSGGELLVAVCDQLDVTKIYGEADGISDSLTFWDLDGSTHIDYGSILVAGQSFPDMVGTANRLNPDDITSIIFRFAGPERDWSAAFNDASVPAKGWLQTDGSVTSEPCAS